MYKTLDKVNTILHKNMHKTVGKHAVCVKKKNTHYTNCIQNYSGDHFKMFESKFRKNNLICHNCSFSFQGTSFVSQNEVIKKCHKKILLYIFLFILNSNI